MSFDWPFFWHYLLRPSAAYLNGLMLTLVLSVVAQSLGTVIGLFAALGRMSHIAPLQYLVRGYVWIMRGTPLLVQIVFIYTGLAAGGIFRFEDISLGILTIPGNVQAGLVALSLNEAAYMAEIIRAGISSVDSGQTEAAKSLGMTYGLVMRRIVLPQATRFVIPPLGNEFNAMLKNTTLVSVIGVPELLLTTETLTSATFRVFELYSVVALYYLTLTTLWGVVQGRIEARFGEPTAQTPTEASFGERLFGRTLARMARGKL
ncbi:MAG TPA: amino acid ABC transporter permease [Alphaproteobacteria bacterium]|nr:amino acid ABC transporter permease [Alphaproteobacteria bacterium]